MDGGCSGENQEASGDGEGMMKRGSRTQRGLTLAEYKLRCPDPMPRHRGINAILMRMLLMLLVSCAPCQAKILIPMDGKQTDHLRAYGVTYFSLQSGSPAEWLLNYRGGSFLLEESAEILQKLAELHVAYEKISSSQEVAVFKEIAQKNMERVRLEKAPKIAVYSPPDVEPWDDAVTLALTYTQIPYDTVWDDEVISGRLENYDWLHLHHEDFTGQLGKFYFGFRNELWYQKQARDNAESAARLGFSKVPKLKLAAVRAIKKFVESGKLLFAMCSATDSVDIALSAENTDIVAQELDGDPADPMAQSRLDFSRTFAFTNFIVELNLFNHELSDINVNLEPDAVRDDFFELFEFSAKQDPILSMLTQNHTKLVHDFLGQTTAFNRAALKDSVLVLGEVENTDRVKYIHGMSGKGSFTFFAGHDPEDYAHMVGESPTELKFYPHSPGYRLILNNVLFPAAKKKKQKT